MNPFVTPSMVRRTTCAGKEWPCGEIYVRRSKEDKNEACEHEKCVRSYSNRYSVNTINIYISYIYIHIMIHVFFQRISGRTYMCDFFAAHINMSKNNCYSLETWICFLYWCKLALSRDVFIDWDAELRTHCYFFLQVTCCTISLLMMMFPNVYRMFAKLWTWKRKVVLVKRREKET